MTKIAATAGTVLAIGVTAMLSVTGAHAPIAPDFSGRWNLVLAVRPTSGGPTTAVFGAKLTPPMQVAAPPLTSTGSRPAAGTVSFQSVIGVDGKIVDIEPILATVWSGFLPDLVTTMTESQRRQLFRAARLNGQPVATILNSVSQTTERPATASSQNTPLTHEVTVEQTAATLTSRRMTPVGIDLVVYALDGTARKTRLTMAAPAVPEWEHTSRWDGDKLMTTSVGTADGGVERRTETRFLQNGSMIVETTWSGTEGVPAIVKRLVYSRIGSTGG